MWLRHMAQLSTTMSHAQRATAFHWGPVSSASARAATAAYLLDLEALLVAFCAGAGLGGLRLRLGGGGGGIGHVHVGHGVVGVECVACGELCPVDTCLQNPVCGCARGGMGSPGVSWCAEAQSGQQAWWLREEKYLGGRAKTVPATVNEVMARA